MFDSSEVDPYISAKWVHFIPVVAVFQVVLDKRIQQQTGFTLIEILIVVIFIGILATIIIPQVMVSSDDAKLNTLKANLSHMRSIIELYYYQHNNTYPGFNDGHGDPAADADDAEKGFRRQLTRHTDLNGKEKKKKDATHKFGPYIKGGELPTNPYNGKNNVKCDITTTDITVKASDGSTGWKFYTQAGILIANDGDHDDQ